MAEVFKIYSHRHIHYFDRESKNQNMKSLQLKAIDRAIKFHQKQIEIFNNIKIELERKTLNADNE